MLKEIMQVSTLGALVAWRAEGPDDAIQVEVASLPGTDRITPVVLDDAVGPAHAPAANGDALFAAEGSVNATIVLRYDLALLGQE